jgi:hypothetical protein
MLTGLTSPGKILEVIEKPGTGCWVTYGHRPTDTLAVVAHTSESVPIMRQPLFIRGHNEPVPNYAA